MKTEKDKFEKHIINLTSSLLKKYKMNFDDIPERERYFAFRLQKCCLEIIDSRRSLDITKILTELSPKKTKRISKQEYIQYQINNYLHEIYIIKLRIIDLINFIGKMYRKTLIKTDTNTFKIEMSKLINDSFKHIISTRGAHVHEERFEDKYIQHMSTTHFLSKYNNSLIKDADWGYKATKFIWVQKIKKNNETIDELLEILFSKTNSILIKNERIITPSENIDHDQNKRN